MEVWCKEGKEVILEIGKIGDKKAKNYIIQSISKVIQKRNAASVLG